MPRSPASRHYLEQSGTPESGRLMAIADPAIPLPSNQLDQISRGIPQPPCSATLTRAPGSGSKSRMAPALLRQLEKLFDEGATVDEAHAKVKHRTSRGSVGRVRRAWQLRKKSLESEPRSAAVTASQLVLVPPPAPEAATGDQAPATAVAKKVPAPAESPAAPAPVALVEAPAALAGPDLRGDEMESANSVQHLGTWLLIAMTHRLGLYRHAASVVAERVEKGALRLAIDAVVAALAVSQRCAEGVRRLATSTASALLLASGAPSPSWTRRTLGLFAADSGGAALHLRMAREYLVRAQLDASSAGPVFYIDNHMRKYTGKHTLLRGWRMQDKRVKPGVSDYYVHDEDGRPVARLAVPSHDSLTKWMSPIARLMRLALGEEETILLAFDRAGAFPEQMAELRNEKFEFVTYERRPYQLLPASAFTEKLVIGKERLLFCEPARANLGAGRGRVRRIAVRTPEGKQVNLVAVSERSPKELILVMRGRWKQENGFKHAAERWGINQLDGRKVVSYAPETVIPNPARRRLDRGLAVARASEGDARNQLARLAKGDAQRAKAEKSLEHALAVQKKLLALRPSLPKHAPVAETELADELVHHPAEYKMTLDTIRIACANAESDLAAELALRLPRATEAKKTLANLFAAPGDIRAGKRAITVCLSPAGTKPEQRAFSALLQVVNGWKLTLPGDQRNRQLRFRTSGTPQVS